jgi:hypothetical protein
MPTLVGVAEFVKETKDDYHSPITSTFVSRMAQFRNTIATLEEVRKMITSINRHFPFYSEYFSLFLRIM